MSNIAQKCIDSESNVMSGGALNERGVTTMNPITVFLTVACLLVGAGLGATGHLYAGIPVVIAAILIASAMAPNPFWSTFGAIGAEH
jgi:hypothetical protein